MSVCFQCIPVPSGSTSVHSGVFRATPSFFAIVGRVSGDFSPETSGEKTLLHALQLIWTRKDEPFADMAGRLRPHFSQDGDIFAVIGVFSHSVLHVLRFGKCTAGVVRDKQIARLFSSSDTVSGKIQDGDCLFICSHAHEALMKQRVLSFQRQPFSASLFHTSGHIGNFQTGLLVDVATHVSLPSSHTVTDSPPVRFRFPVLPRFPLFRTTRRTFDRPSVLGDGADTKIERRTLFGDRALRLWTRTTDRIRHLFFQQDERVCTAPDLPRSKRMLRLLAVFLVIFLIGSVSVQFRATRRGGIERDLDDALHIVSNQYDEAVRLIDLNPVRARELLLDSKIILGPFLGMLRETSDDAIRVQEWLQKISALEVSAYHIYKLTTAPVFFDLGLISPDGRIDVIAAYLEQKALLDTGHSTVYLLSTSTKQSRILAGGDTVKDARSLAVHGDAVFVLTSEGIVRIERSGGISEIVVPHDDGWGTLPSLVSYAGNLYLLDSTHRTIWKYIATEDGFGSRVSYLNPDISLPFQDSAFLAIDGSVWVANPLGSIVKYSSGQPDAFQISGIAGGITRIDGMWVSEEEMYLYILDTELSRIVVFDKSGAYQKQYQWDGLAEATALVASEREGQLFVASAGKIYSIDIARGL